MKRELTVEEKRVVGLSAAHKPPNGVDLDQGNPLEHRLHDQPRARRSYDVGFSRLLTWPPWVLIVE